jgi:hypothetical protein
MHRRDLLRAGLAGFAALAGRKATSPSIPRTNGGINVQPVRRLDSGAGFTPPLLVQELVDAQIRAVYELGFEHVRVTISFDRFGPDFVAAIPFVRAARALGMDVVGILGQHTGFDLVQALSRSETRDEVLETYARIFGDDLAPAGSAITPGRFSLQILNEPTHFLGIPPETYVREYLRPAYYHLKEDDPRIEIVSAAAIGSAEGLLRARRMIESGLELYCDRLGLHVYGTGLLRELGGLSDKPVWVTETGVPETSRHLAWMTETYDRIRREIPGAERIFWFQLYDFEPGRFRLIDLLPALDGTYRIVPESAAALALLSERIETALAGVVAATYRELVPDVTLYFPTEEDFRIIRSTSIGARTWPS